MKFPSLPPGTVDPLNPGPVSENHTVQLRECYREVHMQDDDGDFPLSYVLYYVIGATCVIGVVLVGCGYLWLR